MWRVRVKYKGEHMHVGYYRDEDLAKLKLQEALADPPYLEERVTLRIVAVLAPFFSCFTFPFCLFNFFVFFVLSTNPF
jgi:hypothetical protein